MSTCDVFRTSGGIRGYHGHMEEYHGSCEGVR